MGPARQLPPLIVGQWSQSAEGLPQPKPLLQNLRLIFWRYGQVRVVGLPVETPQEFRSTQLDADSEPPEHGLQVQDQLGVHTGQLG